MMTERRKVNRRQVERRKADWGSLKGDGARRKLIEDSESIRDYLVRSGEQSAARIVWACGIPIVRYFEAMKLLRQHREIYTVQVRGSEAVYGVYPSVLDYSNIPPNTAARINGGKVVK